MTAPKPKPITAEAFIAKLRRRAASSDARLAQYTDAAERRAHERFLKRENQWRCEALSKVAETERPPAVTMAHALNLAIDDPSGLPPPPASVAAPSDDSGDETPSRPSTAEYDAEEIPRGAQPFTPGPAAQAARGRR